ncbi:MAG: glycine cleavage system protein GcvH [Bdellovibrionales bacterium]|nr:glycine cleavage system protein GcvH [Bdellovibrionales bacterium]
MNYPSNYRYTKDHEWCELASDTRVKVGITDHAQSSLGDIVYLDLPKVGRELKFHETFGVVESIKAVSDLYSPLAGTVVETNADLISEPNKINASAHESWMLTLESPTAKAQFETLLTAAAYQDFVKTL